MNIIVRVLCNKRSSSCSIPTAANLASRTATGRWQFQADVCKKPTMNPTARAMMMEMTMTRSWEARST